MVGEEPVARFKTFTFVNRRNTQVTQDKYFQTRCEISSSHLQIQNSTEPSRDVYTRVVICC